MRRNTPSDTSDDDCRIQEKSRICHMRMDSILSVVCADVGESHKLRQCPQTRFGRLGRQPQIVQAPPIQHSCTAQQLSLGSERGTPIGCLPLSLSSVTSWLFKAASFVETSSIMVWYPRIFFSISGAQHVYTCVYSWYPRIEETQRRVLCCSLWRRGDVWICNITLSHVRLSRRQLLPYYHGGF